MINMVLTVAEQCVRQMYFRTPVLRKLRAQRKQPSPRLLELRKLRERLRSLDIREGDSLMVHASLAKLRVTRESNNEVVMKPLEVSELLIEIFRDVVGASGTILMPTFPKYPNEPEYFSGVYEPQTGLIFDPGRTKSKSGVLSEVFRTQDATLRSEFPIQTVAAQGPKASWFVTRNIEDGVGLAHGPNSPYGRLATVNGHVISIGVPLVDYATIVHAPEDARFDSWPIRDFWRPRWIDVVRSNGLQSVKILERDPKYSRGYAEERIRRDLRSERILKETKIDEVEVHSLRAGDLFEMFMRKNARGTYPYFWPRISAL